MKVLHVVNDLDSGGAQTLIEELARTSDSQDVALAVLLGPGSLSRRIESHGFQVNYFGLSKSPLSIFKAVYALRATIRAFNPDIVHSHLGQSDLTAFLATRKSRKPLVSTIHTTGVSKLDSFQARFLARLMPHLYPAFDAVVACSETSASYINQQCKKLQPAVIVNGVEMPREQISKPAQDGAHILVSLARWHPMKDHATMFQAVKLLSENYPSIRLLCAGSGMTHENLSLATLIDEFEISRNIQLLGVVDDVGTLLNSADALVISSAYGEALPMAGLEAISMGIPVITTDVGDCRELVIFPWQIVPVSDAHAFASALASRLALTEREVDALREQCRTKASRQFSISKTVAEYDQIYSAIRRQDA